LKSASKSLTGEVCAMTRESDAVIKVYKKVDSEYRAMTGISLRWMSENLREVSENFRVPAGVY